MAKQFQICFSEVTLLSGTSQDTPMWLWMKGVLFKKGNLENPLWVSEVGGVPHPYTDTVEADFPDRNGRFAERLPYNIAVTNNSFGAFPNYCLAPVAIGADEELHIQIVLAPRERLETHEVDINKFDITTITLFLLALSIITPGGPIAGPVGFLAGLISGLFSGKQEFEFPCLHAAILSTHIFDADDLDDIVAEGGRIFTPAEPPVEPDFCGSNARSTYKLLANSPSFGVVEVPQGGACVLFPRHTEPAKKALEGLWGNTGQHHTDCITVSVFFDGPNSASVGVYVGSAESNPVRENYQNIPVTLEGVEPEFTGNVWTEMTCPVGAVAPACTECRSFSNIGMKMTKFGLGHLLAGVRQGTHAGTFPLFPITVDTNRASISEQAIDVRRHSKLNSYLNRGILAMVNPISITTNGDFQAGIVTSPKPQPRYPDSSWREKVDFSILDIERYDWPWKLSEAWTLRCSPSLRLYFYREIKNGKDLCPRLRLLRTDENGIVKSDVMLRIVIPLPR